MTDHVIRRTDLAKLAQTLAGAQLAESERLLLIALLAVAADRIGVRDTRVRLTRPATAADRRRLRLDVRSGVPLLQDMFQPPDGGEVPQSSGEPEPETLIVQLGIGRTITPLMGEPANETDDGEGDRSA